ncbi:MAG: TVP38/TMEM64 family protein [Spirochaetia bacterium]
MKKKFLDYVQIILFPLLFILIIAVTIIFWDKLWPLFSSAENLRNWVEGSGVWAPIIFVGLQVLQVVIFIIPGEVPQIAGGYLFGLWEGFLLSSLGIGIGSAVNFYLARFLGRPFVQALFNESQIYRFEKISHSGNAQIGFFLFFLIPGIPKDILCYVAGLSPLSLLAFMLLSSIARAPGILGSAMMGSAAANNQWLVAIIVMVLASVLFLLGVLFRDRIHKVIEQLSKHTKEPSEQ